VSDASDPCPRALVFQAVGGIIPYLVGMALVPLKHPWAQFRVLLALGAVFPCLTIQRAVKVRHHHAAAAAAASSSSSSCPDPPEHAVFPCPTIHRAVKVRHHGDPLMAPSPRAGRVLAFDVCLGGSHPHMPWPQTPENKEYAASAARHSANDAWGVLATNIGKRKVWTLTRSLFA
jgi:hypothetical protein